MVAVAATGGEVLIKNIIPSIWTASAPSRLRWAWKSKNRTIIFWCAAPAR
ncbi:MAG: hypothetical protein ACLUBZ_16480 [Ruthenibacterium lactatiformans]